MTADPAPLVPPEVDLRDLPGFMLDTERLLASELWALTRHAPDAFRGAVALWARAWHQVPAASLPDNTAVLAAFADMTPQRFGRHRELVMRGFIKCSDGRFYHRVLAPEALRAWEKRKAYREKREADRKRLAEWRDRKRHNGGETHDETHSETGFETHFNAAANALRQGQGQGQGQEESPPSGECLLPEIDDCAEAVEAWNRLAGEKSLAKCQRLTKPRRSKLAARLKDCGGLAGWNEALERVGRSGFLLGENGRNWRADFDFLLQEKSFVKLMEGGYDRAPGPASGAGDRARKDRMAVLRAVGLAGGEPAPDGLPAGGNPAPSAEDSAGGGPGGAAGHGAGIRRGGGADLGLGQEIRRESRRGAKPNGEIPRAAGGISGGHSGWRDQGNPGRAELPDDPPAGGDTETGRGGIRTQADDPAPGAGAGAAGAVRAAGGGRPADGRGGEGGAGEIRGRDHGEGGDQADGGPPGGSDDLSRDPWLDYRRGAGGGR